MHSSFRPKMRRLQNIVGCYPVFLEIASRNLDSEKNIRSEELKAVADTVNKLFVGANLCPYDVQEIWVEIQESWKVWSEVTKNMDIGCIDLLEGKIKPYDAREWDVILKKFPDAIKFKSGNFPLAGQVNTIFYESNAQKSKNSKKKKSEVAGSSSELMREEKEEIQELMHSLDRVSKLRKSLEHVLFCTMLFESKKSREYFISLRTDDMKFKFVDDEYRKFSERLVATEAAAATTSTTAATTSTTTTTAMSL